MTAALTCLALQTCCRYTGVLNMNTFEGRKKAQLGRKGGDVSWKGIVKEEKKEGRGDSRGTARGSVRKTPGMSRVKHMWLGSVCIGDDVDVC